MFETMSERRLQTIKERRAKVTPPPWAASVTVDPARKFAHANGPYIYGDPGSALVEDQAYKDADFIANAPSDVDELVAEVERLRAALRQSGVDG